MLAQAYLIEDFFLGIVCGVGAYAYVNYGKSEANKMTVHITFIELKEKLRTICDCEYDLTSGSGFPIKGDVVWLYDKTRLKQFWVVERHWYIGTVVGQITIYVTSKHKAGV